MQQTVPSTMPWPENPGYKYNLAKHEPLIEPLNNILLWLLLSGFFSCFRLLLMILLIIISERQPEHSKYELQWINKKKIRVSINIHTVKTFFMISVFILIIPHSHLWSKTINYKMSWINNIQDPNCILFWVVDEISCCHVLPPLKCE